MRKTALVILTAFISGVAGAYVFGLFQQNNYSLNIPAVGNVSTVNYQNASVAGVDFVKASQVSTPCVVFIKTLSAGNQNYDPFFDFWSNWDFFGKRGPVSSSGSGVIITPDGYIVTNNHVVKDAETIEVILNNNKHSFSAKVVGTDPSTDLALLKIEGKNLPAVQLGNSDAVNVGDWVLAVGNPFNLTSTVTAGIVSAKGRNINIVNNQFPIESFIQTDAAINPGNSGGALVNINGELVGINTAISSNTGSYTGYGFAIPVNIVSKIVKDLIEYGEVQRGYTGMDVRDIDAGLANKLDINNNLGVYVDYVFAEGPAGKAGVKVGDVIIRAGTRDIISKATFDEQVSYHRPGEMVKLLVMRSGKPVELTLKLINREGNTEITKKELVSSTVLGADFQMLSKMEKERLGINSGVRISNIRNGRIRNMNIPDGFVISMFNKKEYSNAEELVKAFENVRGQILIEGYYPNGTKGFFSFYSY